MCSSDLHRTAAGKQHVQQRVAQGHGLGVALANGAGNAGQIEAHAGLEDRPIRPMMEGREVAMRAVVQRVSAASVTVAGQLTGEIGRGLLVLLSVGEGDGPADLAYVVDKVAGLRVFADPDGKMNLDVRQVGGSVLLVSQFTLHGDVRKGKRPSFTGAMAPAEARAVVAQAAAAWRGLGVPVAEGVFGADMQVALVNDGPVTILLDSQRLF